MSKKIGKLAKRYAKALLGAVEQDTGKTAAVEGEQTPAQKIADALVDFSKLWETQPELSSSVTSPMFDEESRKRALLSVGKAAGLDKTGVRFLELLFDRDRISALPEIAEEFHGVADEAASIIPVTIRTAREIAGDEAKEIEQTLRGRLDGKPIFAWEVDKTLVGGIVVHYGGKVLDGSLSGRLDRIERSLS